VGSRVSEGEPVLLIRHRGGRGLPDAQSLLRAAIRIEDDAPQKRPIVVDRVVEER
jgi:hypothetical protein